MIGVISDTHDNVPNLIKAIKIFENAEVDFIIHCGDLVAPATAKYFNGIHTKMVKGNCDGDVEHIKQAFSSIGGEYVGEIGKFEIDGKKIIAYHGDDEQKLQGLIDEQKYDYVLTGHTHKTRDEKVGKTRVINPGAHYFGAENKVVLLDVQEDIAEFVKVG